MSFNLAPEVYRAVLEILPIGVYMVDRDRRIMLWNEGAEKISGYLRQEVIGRSCADNLLMHCDENNSALCELNCPLLGAMHGGHQRDAEVFLRHKDGQRVPVCVRTVPFRDENGILLGAVECFVERVLTPEADLNPHNQAVLDHLDGLTGIPDHASIQSHLKACLEDFAEQHALFGVLSIAVDGLDQIRLSRGRKGAEATVRVVARTLARNIRPSDMVGRWGEGGFVVIVTNFPAAALARLAEALRQIVHCSEVHWWGDRISPVITLGGAVARDGDTADSLLVRSQQALQTSLEAGGGQVVIL
jgi:PAS domain S-box-containing protein/diguanylate cyclase (GGDEF)-like protein